MELWAGMECTVNRVGDRYFDQVKATGHEYRPEDIDRLYELGFRTLRYPILWERTAPDQPDVFDWSWPDERLERMRSLGIRPIAGLLHHGSGPAYCSLHDPDFPVSFARYAAAFARRYPWVQDYTPVNEPLTTARFSGLYGHWYPHGLDEHTFLTALIQQCRAIQLAMQEIRKINPAARLIQTEDMGKYWSVPSLDTCAEFLNLRRWLSLDLLCGRVVREHPLWRYLHDHGITSQQLLPFLEAPCPPDIIGINYYILSERFIDDAFMEYAPETRDAYERHGYVDIEAVRTSHPIDLYGILQETWERYGLPMAITETHLNCTREEQLRWFTETWHTAHACVQAGMDLRAVTAWSVFGAYNWDKLLTCESGCYETGLFDVRGGSPRPTALAQLVKSLLDSGEFNHPVLAQPGWWQRPERIFYPHARTPEKQPNRPDFTLQPAYPLIITDATSQLGEAVMRSCELRAIAYRLLDGAPINSRNTTEIGALLTAWRAWALIDTTDYAELDQKIAATVTLATACAQQQCSLLTFDLGLVFDGVTQNEMKTFAAGLSQALIVQTGDLFGPWDTHNFILDVLHALSCQELFYAGEDKLLSPTYLPDLVNNSLDLLLDGATGRWLLSHGETLNQGELARKIAAIAGFDSELVVRTATLNTAKKHLSANTRSQMMPSLDSALAHYVATVDFVHALNC